MVTNIDIIAKIAININCSKIESSLYTRQKTKEQDLEERNENYINRKLNMPL